MQRMANKYGLAAPQTHKEWNGSLQDTIPAVLWQYALEVPRIFKYECKKEGDIGIHTLTINGVSVNDSGIFRCTEDEGRGPDSDSARLHVFASCKL